MVRWGLLGGALVGTLSVGVMTPGSGWAQAGASSGAPDQASPSGPPSVANGADQAKSGEIADIVVTAQRRSEKLSTVPIAVTAITADNLENADISTTIDLPRVTPGLTVGSSTQANAYFTPVLRGVGALTPALGNDNSVALYVDGIYQSDKTASNIDLAGVGQIEVLKGPQGTLYGRNATGGAINVTTLGPTDHLQIQGEASYGNLDKATVRLFVATPITEDLGVSIAYLHRSGGDYEHNINPLYVNTKYAHFGGTDTDAITGKVDWHPEDFEATLSLIYYKKDYSDLNPLSPVPGTDPIGVQLGGTAGFARYTYTGQPVSGSVEYFQPSAKLRYSLDGVDLVSITGYTQARTEQNLDYSGTSADLFFFENFVRIKDVSEELQALTTGDGPVQATGGLYYYEGRPREPILNIIQNAPAMALNTDVRNILNYPGGSEERVSTSGNIDAKAIYGQATYDVGGLFKATAGLRYSHEARNYEYSLQGIGQLAPGFVLPDLTPLGSHVFPTVHNDKLTWRFGLDHQFTPDILGYATYNRGFKSGVYNFSDFTPTQKPVRPEVLDAFEIGEKARLFDNTLQIDSAAFYYYYRDLQVSYIAATTSAAQILQNAGAEKIFGIDGDIIYKPTPDLTLRFNGSSLHAQFGRYQNAGGFLLNAQGVPVAASIDATDSRGLGAPVLSFDAGADYSLDLPYDWTGVATGDFFHTSSFKTVVGEGNVVNAYDRLDASVTFYAPGEHYYVRVFGHNITDVQQIGTGTSPFRLAKTEIEPATYGVAIGFNF